MKQTLYQQIDAIVWGMVGRADITPTDITDKIMEAVDASDEMRLEQIDRDALAGETFDYRGADYTVRRAGYEYIRGDKIPYVELLDCKTGHCAVYAALWEVNEKGKKDV